MVKKSGVFIIIIANLLLFQLLVAANVSFSDLQQDHWAHEAVMKLVDEGTIKGFEDGQFKPDNTVSRAEFVKMIGKGSTRKEMDFNDVSSAHWGYEYIMYSGLKGDANNHFNPDVPITRFDVLQLIWERAGSKTGVNAPKIITDQGSNRDAVAWGYVYGLMRGDDGLHLRLDDVLSRAEAAALIIRARGINDDSPQSDFIDTVQPELLEKVFNSVRLFDNITYESKKNITNGQLAKAVLRLGAEEYTLTYKNYAAAETFKNPYAQDLYVVGNDLLGNSNINETFIEQNATMRDTLAALTFYTISKAHMPLPFGNKDDYYKDVQGVDNEAMNICLTFAYQNGVRLFADGKINADASVTLKEFAGMLLQLDYLMGVESSSVLDSDKMYAVREDIRIEKDLSRYTATADDFQCVLENTPQQLYTVPFSQKEGSSGTPKMAYDFAREFGDVFSNMLSQYNTNIKQRYNVKTRITYYPALTCDNGNGYTFRAKVEIIDTPSELRIKDVFNGSSKIDENQTIHNGMVFYGDIVTGQLVSDVYLPSDKAGLDQIVVVVNN